MKDIDEMSMQEKKDAIEKMENKLVSILKQNKEDFDGMRLTEDALEELGSERLEKAVENARNEERKTVRKEDLS